MTAKLTTSKFSTPKAVESTTSKKLGRMLTVIMRQQKRFSNFTEIGITVIQKFFIHSLAHIHMSKPQPGCYTTEHGRENVYYAVLGTL